jgi:hypothetical protein
MTEPERLTAVRVDDLVDRLRRHVGHSLRCVKESSGVVEGYVVETVALRCDDCGEVVLEAVRRLLKRFSKATRK